MLDTSALLCKNCANNISLKDIAPLTKIQYCDGYSFNIVIHARLECNEAAHRLACKVGCLAK